MRLLLSLAAVTGALAVALFAGWLGPIDQVLRDARFGLDRREPTGQIVFVEIDARSLEAVGVWPWPRRIHAEVLSTLLDLGAAEVAFDIDFSTASTAVDDAAFEQGLADAGGYATLAGFRQLNRDGPASALTLPLERFAKHTGIAGVNVAADSGGVVRRIPYQMRAGDEAIPSLPTVLAAAATPEEGADYLIDYSINPARLDRISIADLLAGNIAPERIKDRKVLVGASALELRDVMMTPIDGPLPGGMIQILGAETLLQGRALRPPNPWLGLLALTMLGAALFLLRRRLALWSGILAAVALSAGVEVSAFALQDTAGVLIDTAASHLLTIGAVVAALALEAFERRRLHLMAARQHTEALERLAHAATYDAVTGALTRQGFIEYISKLLTTEARVAVVSVRLDRFERIVATLGSSAAEQALRNVVSRLSALSPLAFGRIGDGTFVLLVPADAVDNAIERLPALLDETVSAGDHQITLRASVGVAYSGGQDEPDIPETLLNHAEVARTVAHSAKSREPIRYQRQMERSFNEARELEIALREALAENSIEAHFQGQFDLSSGQLCGAEALARWSHPRLGSVPPSRFVPLAEQTGLAIALGRHMLRTACQSAAGWPATIRVAVNLSPAQFEFDDVAALVAEVLESTGLDPLRLDVEITEGLVLRAHPSTMDTLGAIRAMGVGIALDDFGTGYSSLSYLGTLPISQLKIDQSFVRRLFDEKRVETIVEAILSLCAALEITVVAEGIETEAQAAWLRARNCEIGQGYLFHRPSSAVDFAYLARQLRSSDDKRLPLRA